MLEAAGSSPATLTIFLGGEKLPIFIFLEVLFLTEKILHVVRPAQGGMLKHLETLFQGMGKEYHLYLAAPPSYDSYLLRAAAQKRYLLPLDESLHPLENWRIACSLAQFISQEKIDLVHTHGIRAGIVGQAAALMAGRGKVVATMHNMINYGMMPFSKVFQTMHGILMRRTVHTLITVSEAIKKEVIKYRLFPPEMVTVIYNGVDVNLFSKQSCLDRKISFNGPVIGTVARLEPAKGIKYLLDAAAIIDKEYPWVYFVIVGDGPQRNFLQQYAARLGIDKKVFFLGFRDDVPNILPLFDIAVIPSVQEGLSIFCLEALAAGCPVVASDVGGLTEIIIPCKNGLLVPPKDPRALADALVALLKNRILAAALGRQGRKMVEQKFTYEKMLERTMKIYAQLLQPE